MVNINSVEGVESLIEKKTRPLKGQIRELQTELIKLKQALTIQNVVLPTDKEGTLCEHRDEDLIYKNEGFGWECKCGVKGMY